MVSYQVACARTLSVKNTQKGAWANDQFHTLAKSGNLGRPQGQCHNVRLEDLNLGVYILTLLQLVP